MMRKLMCATLLPVLLAAGTAGAQTFSGSVRARMESWRWFEHPTADGSYSYVGVLARGALSGQGALLSWRVEAAAPILLGLPDDAVAPAPGGQLGAGASYWQANDSSENVAGLFLKQAYVRLGRPVAQGGHSIRAGRFEFVGSTELVPGDPTLAALKRERAAHRLVGNFGWTHVQRSYDGVHYVFDRGGSNVSVAAMRPTRGVFDADGWTDLDIGVAYAAFNRAAPRGTSDWRIFLLGYQDYRDDPRPLKVDNRPATARAADAGDIEVGTIGAHYIRAWPLAAGTVDLLFWGALQGGNWGALEHNAHAFSLEAGIQPRLLAAWKPWLRVAYQKTSGDDDAADDRHETFFAVLPTPRIYARFPFYNMMNTEDLSVSLLLRPTARLTLRAEAHRLLLSEGADLWYAGGGAFEAETFGYAGRPANAETDLANTFDLSADFRVSNHVSVNLYGAIARGGDVVERIFSDRDARFGYVELELRK